MWKAKTQLNMVVKEKTDDENFLIVDRWKFFELIIIFSSEMMNLNV